MLARMKTIGTAMNTESNTGLYRLLAWASPAFPTGAFSYSHGLEAAAADGAVQDRATLEAWIAALVIRGSGRIDADILRDAWRAAAASDDAGLAEVNRRGLAYRATAELALESGQQGAAFTAAYNAAWADPHPPIADAMGPSLSRKREKYYSAASLRGTSIAATTALTLGCVSSVSSMPCSRATDAAGSARLAQFANFAASAPSGSGLSGPRPRAAPTLPAITVPSVKVTRTSAPSASSLRVST
jgi:urease accessory protein UreF